MEKTPNEIVIGGMNNEQIELIKNTVAKGATNTELQLFLYTAQRTGLDPLTRQIHFVKRGGQMTIQTGIDGYRAIADRTGALAGIDDPIYDSEDGQHPNKATVAVYKLVDGQRVAFTASARWAEYAPTGSQAFMWNKMPYLMLGKCAEALALRKAFPSDLSGLYTNEEMHQADKETLAEYDQSPIAEGAVPVISYDDEAPAQTRTVSNTGSIDVENPSKPWLKTKKPTELQLKKQIMDLASSIVVVPLEKAEYKGWIEEQTGLELTPANFDAIIERLTALK